MLTAAAAGVALLLLRVVSVVIATVAVAYVPLGSWNLVVALLIAGALAVYSVWVGLRVGGERPRFSWRELGVATRDGVWALLCRVPTRTVPGRNAITRVQPPAARERQAEPASTVK